MTGVIGGVSPGTVTINSLGFDGTVATHLFTVSTPPAAILAPSSLAEGDYQTLLNSVPGGRWSSSNPSVLRADSTGTYWGMAPGAVRAFYTMGPGCADSVPITVIPFSGISGNIVFSGRPYVGMIKLWLIRYDASTAMLSACDSIVQITSGTHGHYSFHGALTTDSFRVKAAQVDSLHWVTGYVPTYHTSSTFWNSATVFHHTSGASTIYKDINMISGMVTSGPGFIAGSIYSGAGRGTSGGAPVEGVLVYLLNSAGTIMQSVYTSASGDYSFSGLPLGIYSVHPEVINYATLPYSGIHLTTSAPSLAAANFKQGNDSKTITPISTATGTITAAVPAVAVFPNPSVGNLTISWNSPVEEKGIVALTDIAGRQVYDATIGLTKGVHAKQFDFTGLAEGVYNISVTSEHLSYNSKIIIQR